MLFSTVTQWRQPTSRLARSLAALGLLLAAAGAAQAQTSNFAYTGSPQSYTVPAGITKLNVTATGGAGGGNRSNSKGGLGAVVQATVTVIPGEVLTVVVGGQGIDSNNGGSSSAGGAGGYNGGGNGAYTGGGGGGATDLRRAAANGSTGDYFASRNALLVAGGGGGGDAGPAGGNAGTPDGGNGVSGQGGPAGQGATTTALGSGYLGSNGTGGNGNPNNFNAAGGGGYYGGGGGGGAAGTFGTGLNGGGGGSSYVLPTGSSNVSYSLAASRSSGALAITPVLPSPNNALAFNGTNNYVALPSSTPVPVGNSAYTIEAWIKPTSMGMFGIAGWGNFGTQNQVNALRLDASGVIYNYWWNNDLAANVGNISGQWHHVAATFDGTTRRIYLDGVLKASDTPSGHNVPDASNLRIGSTCALCGGEYYSGSMDEVRIYNIGLTQAQVQADMFGTAPVVPGSLKYSATFDQGTAGGTNAGVTSLPDLSGNGSTGTLTNFALTGTTSNWVRSFPTITGISPSSGAAGSSVTVTGTNLTDATGFKFSTTAVAPFTTPTDDFSTTVTVPAGASTGLVSLSSATLTKYNGPSFTFLAGDLVVSTTMTIPPATYNNITVTGTGNGRLGGDVVVNGALVVQNGGTLSDGCNIITGSGTFTLAAGGTLSICRPRGILAPGDPQGNIGTVRVTGGRSFSNDASYVYAGSDATGSGLPSQVRNLSVTVPGNVDLSAPTSISQTLTLSSSGNLVLGSNALTLLSSASGTALVVNSGTGTVVGDVTVQRYIDPSQNSGAGYRHFSSPVANTTVGDLATSGFAPVLTTAYNTAAAPGSTVPFPNVFAYDQSRVTLANSYTPFDRGYVVPASTAAPLAVGQGYAVNIAGSQLVDFVGTLNNGPQTLNLSRVAANPDAGWQLLGNPYPAPLDYSLVNSTTDRANLDAAIYVFSSSGPYAGQYRSYANGVGGNSVLPVGQGFFVRVSTGQTSGSLTFRNAQRLTAPDATPFQRTAADSRPLVQLDLRGATGPADAFYAYAQAGTTPAFDDQFDAEKLANPTGLNLSSTATSGQRLAIDGRPVFDAATVLPLSVGVPAAGTYTLAATALRNLPAGLDAYLFDAQTGQTVNLRTQPSYAFAVTTAQASAPLVGRFSLRFTAGALATAPALTAAQVALYPNPAHARFAVLMPGVAGAPAVQAELVNALGQVVRRQSAALPASGATLTVETADLAAGVYTLRLLAGATTVAKRVVLY